MTAPDENPLTREAILSGEIREIVKATNVIPDPMTDEERMASLLGMFGGKPATEDVWLFAYGSLIWNPTIEFEESRPVTVHGYHRKFCLEVRLGRGSPEQPGMMLALERGGSCRGVAYRISAQKAMEELEIVWRREMLGKAYLARWLSASTAQGPVKAIGFVINRNHEFYVGDMDDHAAAERIARASGFLGPCVDYLRNTATHLDELGIPDSGLTKLLKLVDQVET